MNISLQTKAWSDSTKCIEKKSLTEHEPKRYRRYDGTHVNIASFVNRFQTVKFQDMAKQFHVGMLTSLINSLPSISWHEISLAWSRHEKEATHVPNNLIA